jgi:hypothetical protein
VLFIYLLALLFGIDAVVLPMQKPFEAAGTLVQFVAALLVVIVLERVAWNLERKRRIEKILNGRGQEEEAEVTPSRE